MVDVARLTPVDPREVWQRESADFTPWLADNLDALGEKLGLDLQLEQREAPVGAFALDILASEVNTGRKVVIENQLDQTNHDHLGKLLTYASGYDADVVVWIAKELREEHRQALVWLNQRTDSQTSFYGVVVGLVRIDNSRPAYDFDIQVRPNQWQKTRVIREEGARVASIKMEAYRVFFQKLIDELRDKHRFTNARAGQPQSWYSFGSGFRFITYGASFARGGKARCELYIDYPDGEQNKRLFDALAEKRASLEVALDLALEWERLDHARASRVAAYRAGQIDDSPEVLAGLQSWFADALVNFKRVFTPALQEAIQTLGSGESVALEDDGAGPPEP